MNIFHFINSRDIREYLKKQSYAFTSLEAAWLIYQCRSATIKEKHAAWQEIVEMMPDCEIAERPHTTPHNSLHQFLKEYIRTEDEILDWFFRDEKNAIYNCEYWENYMWNPIGRYYDSFQKCLKAYTDLHLEKMKFKITKQIVNSGQSTDVVFSADNELLEFDTGWYPEGGDEILFGVLGGLWLDFPTPFKKGDILCEPDTAEMESNGLCIGPFVMLDISSQNSCENTRLYGDESDMNAWGYFLNQDGTVYHEVMSNYMDLEYYHGELSGKKRILKALSNHIKGEIDVGLFANAYHKILCEEYAKSQTPWNITPEGLAAAGLETEQQEPHTHREKIAILWKDRKDYELGSNRT